MNWKHVKNLFLLLLIGVNLLLFYFVYTDYSETAFTDPVTAVHTASILQKDGILVAPSLLAARNDSVQTRSVSYDRESYLTAVAAFLLGKEPDGVYLLPSGIRAETTAGARVYLGNDLSVSYRAPDGGMAAEAALAKNTALPLTDEEKETTVAAFAAALDLPAEAIEDARYSKGGGCTFLRLEQRVGDIPIAGLSCTFGMAGDRIVYVEGRHFFGAPETNEEAPILNRVNILLSERDRGVRGTVTAITLCYALYEEAESETLRFVPAYEVRYADGNTSIVNAISGESIE